MNKFDRIIATLILLQSKRRITATTISERFDISLRTVYRDINTLKNAGIPIIGDPGIGYSILEGYRLPPIMFNEEEMASLLTAEKFIGKVADQQTEAYYSSALLKIKAILRNSEKQSLEILDNSIVISTKKNWENKPFLQDIFKSITAKTVVQIEYQKADDSQSIRLIEPIGCYHNATNWYLVAYCQMKKDYRTFKLNRIVKLQSLDDNFDTKHINLQDYIDRQNDSWKEAQKLFGIEVAFSHEFLQFAENRKYYFGFVEQSDINGKVHMKFLNTSIEIMARWLIQFGDQVTVIAPIELKEKMKSLANQLFKHYSK